MRFKNKSVFASGFAWGLLFCCGFLLFFNVMLRGWDRLKLKVKVPPTVTQLSVWNLFSAFDASTEGAVSSSGAVLGKILC